MGVYVVEGNRYFINWHGMRDWRKIFTDLHETWRLFKEYRKNVLESIKAILKRTCSDGGYIDSTAYVLYLGKDYSGKLGCIQLSNC